MPELIDRYKVIKKISDGYISETFEAHDPGTGRYVAIKLLRDIDNPEAEEEFIKETRVVGRLNHHNIVSIYDVGEHEGHAFIAMELLKGEPLSALMSGGKQFSWSIVSNIALQLASALEYAHNQGVVHGDIRPGNIIWNREDNKVVLTDFGNAKQINIYDTVTLNVAEVNQSTPYLSPELLNKQGADNRSDLFSLGVVLYQMLTGFQPFTSEDFNDLTTQITKRAHKAISVSVTQIPEQLIKIIDKLLYKEPEERYQTAGLLIQDLELLPSKIDVPSPYRGKHHFRIAAGVLIAVSLGIVLYIMKDNMLEIESVATTEIEAAPEDVITPPPHLLPKQIPEKVQISSLQASINTKLAKFECASLYANMTTQNEVIIKGHVSLEDDMMSLMDLMDGFPGLSNVTYEVNAIQWPFCEVIGILSEDTHANISNKQGLTVVNGSLNKQLSRDNKLYFKVTSPDYDSFIYVDYYNRNGTVTHLHQSKGELGAKIKASNNWEISHRDSNSADYSESLVVVLATYNPLFVKNRPRVEPAQQYLAELHREVVVNKVELSATYLMLEHISASKI